MSETVKKLPPCCPLCLGSLMTNYGMAGDGVGVYVVCNEDDCIYVAKVLDGQKKVV